MSHALEYLPGEVPGTLSPTEATAYLRRPLEKLRTKRQEVIKVCNTYGFNPIVNLIKIHDQTSDVKLQVAINMELLSYIAAKPRSVTVDANITINHEVALAALE